MTENKNVENEKMFSTFLVNLPSGGKLYSPDSPLRDGVIEMKYGTTKEEDILLNTSYINKGIVFDKLLESLIVTENINLKDLVLGDLSTLIIESKKSMYGNKSTVNATCPQCGEKITFEIDINNLEVFTVPEGTENNSFEFTSHFGNKFKYHILTHGENEDLKEGVKRAQKVLKRTTNVSMSDRLIAIIDSINGNESKSYIRDYIKNGKMLSIESGELKEDILNHTPDIDLT
jgi:hypothetical protein